MTDRVDTLAVVLALSIMVAHGATLVAFKDAVVIMLAGIWTTLEL